MSSVSSRSVIFVLAALILIGGMLVAISSQPQERRNTLTFDPGIPVHGVPQTEWSARQWQWTLSFPVNISPGQDVSGAACANGQSGPVFFLPHNFAPCTVPAGVAILVPITGTQCSSAESPPFSGTSEEELRACADLEVERYTNITVSVDGQIIPDIGKYRVGSPLFTLALPGHNALGAPAGISYAVADGFQMMLRPLPHGEHEIVVHLELVDGTVLPDKLAHITVASPSWAPAVTSQATANGTATPAASPVVP